MIGAKVSSYGYVQAKNATAMQVALQKYGPLSLLPSQLPNLSTAIRECE